MEDSNDILKIFGDAEIPGNPEELTVLRQWTKELIQERGEDWVKEHKALLLDQWQYILVEMGLPRSR